MSVRLHIDRLVLDGIALAPAERKLMVAAIETELGRLLADAPPAGLDGGFAVRALPAPRVELPAPLDPARLGARIAGALHASLDGRRP